MPLSQLRAGNTAYDVTSTSVSDDQTSTGTTNIVNVTEAGRLLSIVCIQSHASGPDGSPVSNLEITIDGGTTRTIKVHDGATTWATDGVAAYMMASNDNGTAISDTFYLVFGTDYATSLLVAHNISTGTSTTGTFEFAVLRGVVL